MEYIILKKFEEVANYVPQVSAIADKNKDSFGFLSKSAYEQMASKGQLWVLIDKARELKGYLMFGGTMPTLKIFQTYACKSVKGQGIGKKLIDALKDFAKEKNYHSIMAKVASDLPANVFWEKNGFPIHRQIKGGETTKRTINVRGYSLTSNDLFGEINKETTGVRPTGPVLKRPIYALDLNLLLDIVKARPGHGKVIKIMQIGFQGEFSICITPEFKKELERQSQNFPNDPVLRLADAFPELQTKLEISEISEPLRNIVFPQRTSTRRSAQNDESDLIHLAYCISAGISGFITREKALLRACNEIKEKYGVAILSPDEIILDDSDSPEASNPLNSDFSFETSTATAEIKSFIDNYKAPEIITRPINNTSPTKPASSVYTARLDGQLLGVFFSQKPIKATSSAIAALYIDETYPQSIAAIDHFLEMALRYKNGFSYRLDIYIGKDQALTEETLFKRGFFKSDDHFVKFVANIFIHHKNWPQFSKSIKSLCGFSLPEKLPSNKELQNTGICFIDSNSKIETFSWFNFETIIGPRFILTPDRNCILVPIKENFANGLIGNTKNQLSLLSSHDKTLLIEKAYFRSPAKSSIFTAGGIIAFYVSGTGSIQELIGFARITYSDVISIDEATIKLDRQGILSRAELSELADSTGKIHAFTFDNFLEFDNRITFKKAKELKLISNANLVSPEKISIEKLKFLIEHAFND
ncbi:GNAT family N-acetyltransferase [Aquipseudomonas alcaligenes]|uniref:GNAT family N-acetyltransferase n=1 Tax=Aquipseudomonas alcaligenes TaxID=43263 RepID=A0AB73HU11_AQUAC|nr:GNAT family N-acetyltransferase [Pseudomonas alcaligenes]MDH0140928.1 GNAT family N-acetyltransferase [Pseudomonas alcaligenes]